MKREICTSQKRFGVGASQRTGGIWGGNKAGACAFGGVCLFRGLEKVVFIFGVDIELNGGGSQSTSSREAESEEQQDSNYATQD